MRVLCKYQGCKTINLVMRIRGKVVHFGVQDTNKLYGLPNADLRQFDAKYCALGSWLSSHLFSRIEVPQETIKTCITLNEIITEARIWLTIIYSCISLSIKMTNICVMLAQMVAWILDNILFIVGLFVISNLRNYMS